jgi:hypothetical protein
MNTWRHIIFLSAFFSGYEHAFANDISLNDYIQALKAEFVQISTERDDTVPIKISPIEVELSVAVKLEANGKASFYVFEVGANAESISTQKLKFTVSPDNESSHFKASYDSIFKNLGNIPRNIVLENGKIIPNSSLTSILKNISDGQEGNWVYLEPNIPIVENGSVNQNYDGGFLFNPKNNTEPNKIKFIPKPDIIKILQFNQDKK